MGSVQLVVRRGGPHSLSLVLKVGNLATLWIGLGWCCSDGLPLLPHHLLAECMMSPKSLIIHGVASQESAHGMLGRCRVGMESWPIWQAEGGWIFVVFRKQSGKGMVSNGLVRRAKVTGSSGGEVWIRMGWLALGCW